MDNNNDSRLEVGDLVFSDPAGDYGCLVGKVIGITPLGSPRHETGNETDDIHVDFFAPYSLLYSETRKDEIAREFSGFYDRKMEYDELPLNDVIMAPESLVRLQGIDFFGRNTLLKSRHEAEDYFSTYLSDTVSLLREELAERVERNYADYHKSLDGFGKRELIDMAGKIAAMSDAHSYMTTWHSFSSEELDFYLRFQNPLEVVAEAWHERNTNLEDMSYTMEYIDEQRENLLENYPLVTDVGDPTDASLHRYMGVDIIAFLGQIAEKVIIYYPNDWNIDKEVFARIASSENPEDRRIIWHVCSTGTHIKNERDVFIRDSGPYGYMTDYHQNDPDMFGYAVEITGMSGGKVMGNVFEVGNYAEYANHIRDTALPLRFVSLTYSDKWGANAGQTITVSRKEYDDDRHRLMSESGDVKALRWHPAEEGELTELLRQERSIRMAFPIGSREAHVSRMLAKVDDIRKPASEVEIPPPAAEMTVKAKPGLIDKLHTASEKAKAQDAHNNKIQSRKWEERE